MTRCSAKTLAGRRCKHSAIVEGVCFTHSSLAKKSCGHRCYLTTGKCCECEDLRPHDQSYYLRYIDGTGMTLPVGNRNDGYCACCKSRVSECNITVRSPSLVIRELTPVTPERRPALPSLNAPLRRSVCENKVVYGISCGRSLGEVLSRLQEDVRELQEIYDMMM